MSFEVNILPVGEKSNSGDAIAIKFGNYRNNPNDYRVVVIDGGFSTNGDTLVSRINNVFGTNKVDLVISTHPDQDHVSGLHTVLEKMDVAELWMHRPWLKSEDIKKTATDRSLFAELSAGRFKKSLEQAYDLEQLALSKKIPIVEPYSGLSTFGGVVTVLGPSEEFYNSMASVFGKSTVSVSEKIKRIYRELWHEDTLEDPEPNATSPRNNSSVITLMNFGDGSFLFTGDAGVEALHEVANYADSMNINLRNITHFQVPHHGSKRNIGPTILNRIIGDIVPEHTQIHMTSFVSAAVEGKPKHPSALVENALVRRGVRTCAPTQGSVHFFTSSDIPPYPNSGHITMLGLQCEHEDED